LTSLKDHEPGKAAFNASVQLAVDLGDTVKRIDGSEVPLLTPWLGKAVKPKAAPKAKAKAAPKPKTAKAKAAKAKETK
jgi:NADH-quinone oxidoreductase subunit E